jgi:hypothetical protein
MLTRHARSNPAAIIFSRSILAGLALIGVSALFSPSRAGDIPTFAVDASWPKPLPNNWISVRSAASPSMRRAISG